MNYKVYNNVAVDENSMESMNNDDDTHNNNYDSNDNCRQRVEIKLKSPTCEADYIRSEKVHTYNGRATHYYIDEPKRELLLAVKVNGRWVDYSIACIS